MAIGPSVLSRGDKATKLLRLSIERFLADPVERDHAMHVARQVLPEDVLRRIDVILEGKKGGKSYRDGFAIQLAYGLSSSFVDDAKHTANQPGGRGVAQSLGRMFSQAHIDAPADALQNIGKNTNNLARGNFAEFDELLRWADQATSHQRRRALRLVLASRVSTARNVLPLPQIDTAKLTFPTMARLVEYLYSTPSGGAHEQFAIAASFGAQLEEREGVGPNKLRAETKGINVSDASSGAVGDVQLKRGERIEEAFEITANHWATKLDKVRAAARNADLPRIHIVASGTEDLPFRLPEVDATGVDTSVLDGKQTVLGIIALLHKPHRAVMLRRLYELLDRHQPRIELTNAYVNELRRLELTVD